jgi:multicomponent Na+:H+ antiporter subunit F
MNLQLLFHFLVLILIANLLVGIVVVAKGKSSVDKMLAAQLVGSCSVAILLLWAMLSDIAFIDVALVFSLLSGVTAIAFVQRSWRDEQE